MKKYKTAPELVQAASLLSAAILMSLTHSLALSLSILPPVLTELRKIYPEIDEDAINY